jgi:hypothetical protein
MLGYVYGIWKPHDHHSRFSQTMPASITFSTNNNGTQIHHPKSLLLHQAPESFVDQARRGAAGNPEGRNNKAAFLLVAFLWPRKEKSHAAFHQK